MRVTKSVWNGMTVIIIMLLLTAVLSLSAFSSQAMTTGETILDVPFKTQVPPGSWDETKNCGQASSLMVFCYYKGTTPTEQGIKDVDDWFHEKYGDPINDYNGWFTNPEKLATLAREYGSFPDSYKATQWDLDRIKQEIDAGHPVIVAVYGTIGDRNYPEGHWLVVKGYNDTHIICNDPGTTNGDGKGYSNSEFFTAMYAWQGEDPVWDGAVVVVMPATAKTWYVDDDLADYPAADFTKIQDAVNATSAGDTIIVYPGTYTENVDVTKSLTIRSTSENPEDTIVQAASPADYVLDVTADYVNISGFTLTGAYYNYGMNLGEVEYCNISNNIVLNIHLGIHLYKSNNTIVMNNKISNNSDGIYLHSSSNNTIINNNVSNNKYGIYLYYHSSNNLITNNNVSNNKYGIYLPV